MCLVDYVDEEMGREGGRYSWGNFLLEFFGTGYTSFTFLFTCLSIILYGKGITIHGMS